MNRFSTTSLFYSKYLYKLRIRNEIAGMFRGLNLGDIKTKLDTMQQCAEGDLPIPSPFNWGLRTPKNVSLETFMDACVLYRTFLDNKDKCTIRVEGHVIDIYSNEDDWLEKLSKQVNCEQFHSPSNENKEFLKNNTNVVICDDDVIEWPYKVYFGKFVDPNFASYCENNSNIKIGKTALECARSKGWCLGFYFWTTTEKQLMLAQIALGGGVQKIIKYVSQSELHKY